MGVEGGGEGGVSAWLGTEERPRRRSGAPSPPMPPTSTVAGRAVPGQLGGPPRRLSTTPQRLAFPAPAGTQAFAPLLHAPRRWQEVNIEFGIGEFNVENHPRRVLRNFERERGQDGFQI